MGGDRASTREVQQNSGQSNSSSSLFEGSGFMDGLKKFGKGAGEVAQKGWEKGKEAVQDVRNSDAVGQIVDQGKQVANHPTTRRITGEVVEQGKQIGREKGQQVTGVVEAGKRGDVNGVIRNGAPLVRDVLIGPEALALKLAKDKAFDELIKNAPPEQRGQLREARRLFEKTSMITNPNISDLVEGEVKRQARNQAMEAAQNPQTQQRVIDTAKETGSKAGQLFRGLGEKLHIVKPQDAPEQKKH
ncbi:MAG: hypothetical protein K2Y39_08070 [Candidatus Obscuribacterales bacterium]|nr:hypothetical protein [Candidatus Obscuribacterales bacterium]